MGKLTSIVIERMENGYSVEDWYNTKVFCKDEDAVLKQVKKIFDSVLKEVK